MKKINCDYILNSIARLFFKEEDIFVHKKLPKIIEKKQIILTNLRLLSFRR